MRGEKPLELRCSVSESATLPRRSFCSRRVARIVARKSEVYRLEVVFYARRKMPPA